jgi:hypothetical protein
MRRRVTLKGLGIAAGLAGALAGPPASSAGLDCGPPPAPHPEADAVLTQAIVSPQLDTNAGTALASAVRRLRSEGVPRAVIVDHAVAAYCPLVARDGSLTLDRQREAVRRFASTLTSLSLRSPRSDAGRDRVHPQPAGQAGAVAADRCRRGQGGQDPRRLDP